VAFTNTYDVSTPANASTPSGGAAAIRLLKAALQERLNPDHYFEKSGDTVDDDTKVGYHRKATLMKLDADPTAVTDMGILYTKDVAGVPELFFLDENGVSPIQITSGGLLNSTGFISGDFLFTANTGAKAGWTDRTDTYASRYLRVGAIALTTGGSDTHSHTLSIANLPSHNHSVQVPSVGGTWAATAGDGFGGSITGSTGSGATFTGATTPLYVDMRIYQKD